MKYLLLAGLLMGCETERFPDELGASLPSRIGKFTDKENGVVCYTYGYDAGISCLQVYPSATQENK